LTCGVWFVGDKRCIINDDRTESFLNAARNYKSAGRCEKCQDMWHASCKVQEVRNKYLLNNQSHMIPIMVDINDYDNVTDTNNNENAIICKVIKQRIIWYLVAIKCNSKLTDFPLLSDPNKGI